VLLFPFATALVAAHECGHWLFLRADLYAVLVAATGCHNLWRAKILSLRRALKSLTLAQVGELATLHSRDVAVAAWFGWLWLVGFLPQASGSPGYVLVLARLVAWAGQGPDGQPSHGKILARHRLRRDPGPALRHTGGTYRAQCCDVIYSSWPEGTARNDQAASRTRDLLDHGLTNSKWTSARPATRAVRRYPVFAAA
jgi:hypothetical protein